MAERFRLMAVHAHPDDESSKGAATMAKYVDQGVDVLVVSCTGGERGDVLNPRLKNDPEILRDMSQVRRREMAAALRVLGVDHVWLGFVDSGLPEGDPRPPLPQECFGLEPLDLTSEALVRVIREFRPHVVTTYDENGGYPHPDHVMCHTVSLEAFARSGDASAFPRAGQPWQPLKLYYNQTLTKGRILAYHEAMLAAGLESPYEEWISRWEDRGERHISTRIECAKYFPQRDQALLAHATQVDPDGSWFRVPMAMQQEVWPTEDFEVAQSYVPIHEVEDDLFAGLDSPEQASALACSSELRLVLDTVVPEPTPAAKVGMPPPKVPAEQAGKPAAESLAKDATDAGDAAVDAADDADDADPNAYDQPSNQSART